MVLTRRRETSDNDSGPCKRRKQRNSVSDVVDVSSIKQENNQIRLEEDILLLEKCMEILQKRKQSIDSQLLESKCQRDDIVRTLSTITDRKEHLDASQARQQNLLQELQKSLSKSHEILLRLNNTAGVEEEMAQLTREIQEQMTISQQREEEEEEMIKEADKSGSNAIKVWLFLADENVDWLLAVQSIQEDNNVLDLERIFVKVDHTDDHFLQEIQKHTAVSVESWSTKEGEMLLLSACSRETAIIPVIALANFPLDPDLLMKATPNVRVILSTANPNTSKDIHLSLEVSHESVGGVTSTRQTIFVHPPPGNTTMDYVQELQTHLQNYGKAPRSLRSILDSDTADFQLEVNSVCPTRVYPLRALVLNTIPEDDGAPPIYHSGGLLPATPIPDDTLIGYPHQKNTWRVRPLTQGEIGKAYDILDMRHEAFWRIGTEFVPIGILRATLEALMVVVLENTQERQRLANGSPIPPIYQDDHCLEQFWQGYWGTENRRCLMTFLPGVGDPSVLKAFLDVNATEALMQDAACRDVEDAATARRWSLWNTCLDCVLMMRGTDTHSGAYSGRTIMEFSRNVVDDFAEATSVKSVVNGKAEDVDSYHHLDPNVALCPYEIAGLCANPYCTYQHLTAIPSRSNIVPREMLPLPALTLLEGPAQLGKVIEVTQKELPDCAAEFDSATEEAQKQAECETVIVQEETKCNQAVAPTKGISSDISDGSEPLFDQEAKNIKSVREAANGSTSEGKGFAGSNSRAKMETRDSGHETISREKIRLMNNETNDECESSLEFVPFVDWGVTSTWEEENDIFANLEIAGLAGWGSQAKKVQLEPNPTEKPREFWWQTKSQIAAKPVGFEDWLRIFGGFHVMRNRDDNTVFLEYQGPIPTSFRERLAFAARMVDCARVIVHAGRFDLTEPLFAIFRNVLNGAAQPDLSDVGFLRRVGLVTSTALSSVFCSQNGVRRALECHLILAMVSAFLQALHGKLTARAEDQELDLIGLCVHVEELSCLVLGKDKLGCGYLKNETQHRSAWHIRESIKLELFRKKYSCSICSADADVEDCVALLEDTRKAAAFGLAVRSGFSLLSVTDDILRPIWSLVKSFLHQPKETPFSQVVASLRSCIYVCHIVLAVFEGGVDCLESVGGDPKRLSSLSFFALAQLDGKLHGVLKSINHLLGGKMKLPLAHVLLAPLLAASVSFSSHMGFYKTAQHRLEEALARPLVSSTEQYAEVLWSQLLHLRSCLPFSQKFPGNQRRTALGRCRVLTSDLLDSHKQIADKAGLNGSCPHRLCVSGDWVLLVRFMNQQSNRKTAAKLKQCLCSVLRQGTSIGLKTDTPMQAPTSLHRIAPFSKQCQSIADFPPSLLVHCQNIKFLNLASCQLRFLPQSFGLIVQNLSALDISCNNLNCLPDSFGLLENLSVFAAHNNLLDGLPESFRDLSSLRKLHLCDNCLEAFPFMLHKVKQLEELRLGGNNFEMGKLAHLALLLPKLRVFVPPEHK